MKNRMGTFYTNCKVENHVDRKKSVEIPKLLVDTGSEFTWVLAGTLKKAGITKEKKDYTFVMANGQQITRTIGFAIIHVGAAVTIDEVVFAQPGDLELLGARSLEGLNLRVDSRAKKLVAGGPILAAAQQVVKAGMDSKGSITTHGRIGSAAAACPCARVSARRARTSKHRARIPAPATQHPLVPSARCHPLASAQ